jgi:hypothetical protein
MVFSMKRAPTRSTVPTIVAIMISPTAVEKKGNLCQYCTIAKEHGDEAADAWLEAQLPPKKPPMAVRHVEVNKEKQGEHSLNDRDARVRRI